MKFVDLSQDPWHSAGGEDAPVTHPRPAPHLLLDLKQWHAVRDHWPAGLATGLALDNDADVESLRDDLPRLSLITLRFPLWTDGRAYSQARLLRARLRFSGEIRATGQVLVDMLPLLQRTGFDAVQLRADQRLDSAQRSLRFFAGHYQGDAVNARPHFARHSPLPAPGL
jgi:uncharacterized protein (DUF934 family)